jgi:hypothetical protein
VTGSRVLSILAVAAVLVAIAPAAAGAAGARASSTPTQGCGRVFIVQWKHGSANFVRVHAISCADAKGVIQYVLDHGLVKLTAHPHNLAWVQAHGYFVLARKRVDGFTFTYDGANTESHFTGRKHGTELSFSLCWLNVNC